MLNCCKLMSVGCLVLALGACGSVGTSADADVAPSDDANVTDANVVVVDGAANPDAAPCPAGWSGTDCTTFFDDFNRGAGPVGDTWELVTAPGTDSLAITNNKACGDIQAPAFVKEIISTTRFTASMTFEAANAEGLEASFIFSSQTDAATELYSAGCDGGGGSCTLRVGDISQVALGELAVSSSVPNTVYTLTLTLDDGQMKLTMADASGTVGELNVTLPANFTLQRIGVIAGRAPDLALTCIDDFRVQLR